MVRYCLMLLLACPALWASEFEGTLFLAPGLQARVVETQMELFNPGAMDIDPISGDLFIDNGADNENGTTGQIIRTNPQTGQGSVVIRVSNGYCLGFTDDGTMYFGVDNFMLAKWDRQRNLFRKFAIIPGVRGFDVGVDYRWYTGEEPVQQP